MKQSIAHVALVVRDYDEAIAFFTQKLLFTITGLWRFSRTCTGTCAIWLVPRTLEIARAAQ